jgi:hypothetical protein
MSTPADDGARASAPVATATAASTTTLRTVTEVTAAKRA